MRSVKAVSYTHLDVYKRQIKGFAKGEADRAQIEADRGEHTFWYDAVSYTHLAKKSAQATIQGFVDGAEGMLPRVQTVFSKIASAASTLSLIHIYMCIRDRNFIDFCSPKVYNCINENSNKACSPKIISC